MRIAKHVHKILDELENRFNVRFSDVAPSHTSPGFAEVYFTANGRLHVVLVPGFMLSGANIEMLSPCLTDKLNHLV